MTNYSSGHYAEEVAAKYLVNNGYQVLSKNWRNKFCEIDIVAKKKESIYFVEVKYRVNNTHGRGLDYITPNKRKQMELAARFWVSENDWQGDYNLSALEVSGIEYEITEFISEI